MTTLFLMVTIGLMVYSLINQDLRIKELEKNIKSK